MRYCNDRSNTEGVEVSFPIHRKTRNFKKQKNRMADKTLVLLRHGQSVWSRDNRFSGWTDVGLSHKGHDEAVEAGRELLCAGCEFDVAFTSVLKRAIKTLWLVLEELDQMWIPAHHTWRLNERHYAALQGENKSEMADRVGAAQCSAGAADSTFGLRLRPAMTLGTAELIDAITS